MPGWRRRANGNNTRTLASFIPGTNAIESLNNQLRKIIKNRGHFPNDEAVVKLLWLAIRDIEHKRAREAGRPRNQPSELDGLAMPAFAAPAAVRSQDAAITRVSTLAVTEVQGGVNGLPYGPDTCKQRYVWREAIPSDHVCVTPATRQQTWDDNMQAPARRDPTGPYGSDTCKQGYIWRDAFPNDHVCVTPATRQQAQYDNSQAASGEPRLLAVGRIAQSWATYSCPPTT
jgi:hypothetical protein